MRVALLVIVFVAALQAQEGPTLLSDVQRTAALKDATDALRLAMTALERTNEYQLVVKLRAVVQRLQEVPAK